MVLLEKRRQLLGLEPQPPLPGHRLGLETQCTHRTPFGTLLRRGASYSGGFFACARGTSKPGRVSLREGSHCCLAAAGASARAQLHAYPDGGSWEAFPPPVSPSGNSLHTHTRVAVCLQPTTTTPTPHCPTTQFLTPGRRGTTTAAAAAGGRGCPWAGSLLSSCLLYTSPSPRDGLLSRMPSSA